MIYGNIQKDFLAARKARDSDKAAFLGYVIGQIQNSPDVKTTIHGGKVYTNDIVLSVVKNLDKKLRENTDPKQSEIDALAAYLPKMLGEDEIRVLLSDVEGGMKEKMTFLKENYPFQYDGKVASMVAREE